MNANIFTRILQQPIFEQFSKGRLCLVLAAILLFTNGLVAQFSEMPSLWMRADSLSTLSSETLLESIENLGTDGGSFTAQNSNLAQITDDYLQINSRVVIDFAGVQAIYDLPFTESLPITLYAVVQPSGPSGQQYLFDTENRMQGRFTPPQSFFFGSGITFLIPNPSDFIILELRIGESSTECMLNGVSIGSGMNDRPSNNTHRLGGSWVNDRFFNGQLAEYMIFPGLTDESLGEEVYEYIRMRYTPEPAIQPLYTLLPDCSLNLSVEDRFISFEWRETSFGEVIGTEAEIQLTEIGIYELEVETVFGDSYTRMFEVISLETSISENNIICEGQPLNVEIPLDQDSYTVEWNDGAEVFSRNINEEGEYSFQISQLTDGCTFQSIPFQVTDIESVAEILGEDGICQGNSLLIEPFPDLSVLWNTGSTDNLIVPVTEGEYFVEVDNGEGCIGRDTVDVVFQGVVPNILTSVENICFGEVSNLSDLTVSEDANILTRSWSLDNNTFTDSSFTYEPASAGTFPIELIIELSNGCQGLAFDTLEVYNNPIPSFTYDLLCEDQEVIYNSASSSADGVIINEVWSFGDGSSATGSQVENTYNEDGSYEVQLEVETSFGCTSLLDSLVFVLPDGASECQNFSVEPTFWMYFDGSTDVDESNVIVSITDRVGSLTTLPVDETNRAILDSTERINDYPAAFFDGENDSYDFPFNQDEFPFTFFIFLRPQSTSENFFIDTENRMFGRFQNTLTGSYILLSYPIITPRDWFISSFVTDADQNGSVYVNGDLVQEGLNDRPFVNFFRIGGAWTDNRYFEGGIAEILIFDEALDENQRLEIETYLRNKYAPPVDAGQERTILPGCEINLEVADRFNSYQWSRLLEDGSIEFLGNQKEQVISEPGIYRIETVSIFDEISSDSVVVSEISIPKNDFVCESSAAQVDLGITDATIQIDWSEPQLEGSQVFLSEPGEYSVELTDIEGCTFSSSFELFEPEDYVEIFVEEIFCLGNDLYSINESQISLEYLWSTDETTPFIQPQTSGEYWVEATNANGCIGRDTVEVDIVGIAPTVDFGFSPPCENNEVDFDDLTEPEGGSITIWDWTFENTAAGNSDQENPSIFYESTGEYPIELTVTLDNGCTGTGRDTLFVNPLPLVNFSAPIVCAGNEVFFESLSVVPGGGTIAGQEWSFGNGTFDSGSVGSTTFEILGANTVTHIVTSEDQCTDSLTRNVEVLGSPIVDFEIIDVCLGELAVFQEDVDISVSGPVFYNWQFGDGFFSNFPNTTHEYAQPGVYDVTLTATGNNLGVNGCTDQITKQIRVYEPPTPEITTGDACLGAVTELVDLTIPQSIADEVDRISSRLWTVVDGPTGSQQGELGTDSAQVFIPEAAGTFEIQLELLSESGCSASIQGSVFVQAIPSADFAINLPIQAPPFSVIPDNLTVDGESYEWLVNGTVVSTEFEPALNFETPGDYEVWLVATNNLNCNDTAKTSFTAIIPEYDLEMVDLQYQTVGNNLLLVAFINNNGNVPVEFFDSEIEVGRDIKFNIDSEWLLPPGQLTEYPLGTEIGYLPGRDLPYTCMRVSNPNGEMESDTTNNKLCIGLNRQKATFAPPFPNPASNEVHFTIVMPIDAAVAVEITGSDGKLIESFTLDLKEGLNELDYPLIGWSEGLYFVKFKYDGQDEVFRLVIAR